MLFKKKAFKQREAFHELVNLTQADLYAMILGMTHNAHDAEDVLQETYLNAYRSFERFRGDAAPRTWLYRIAVNRYLDSRRSAERKPLLMAIMGADSEHYEQPSIHPETNPERMIEAGMLRDQVEKAMGALSPLERTVFVLRHHQELSLKETAQVLERAEGTVKSIHFRAIRKLRDILAPVRRPATEEL